jgi:polysaccharide biosynthesis transport protein
MSHPSLRDTDASIDMGALFKALLRKLPRMVLVTVLLLGATYAVLLFVPKTYESTAGILVEPRSNAYTRAANDQQGGGTISETGLISSQIELIRSRDTLLPVIDSEGLRSVAEFNGSGGSPLGMIMQIFGHGPSANSVDETVLSNLLDRMTVIQERDSRIVSVIVRSTDPDLAARLANAIANAHVQRRASLSISDTVEAGSWLESEIAELRQSVKEAEDRVAAFKVDNDLFDGANNTSLLDQQLTNISNQINAAQERRNTAQTRATVIRSLLESGQAIDGLPDVRNSVVIQQLSQQKAELQAQRAQLSATLLPNHPTLRALISQVRELDQQIADEGQRVAASLDAEAQIESGIVESLQAELDRLKATASDATLGGVQLEELQREAAAQRQLLESYLLRYSDAVARSESNSALPDVRVVTLAAASVNPSSPKTTLILMAVGIVSLVLQVGGVIFGELTSGRALRTGRDGVADPVVPTFGQRHAAAVAPVTAPAAAVAPLVVPVGTAPVADVVEPNLVRGPEWTAAPPPMPEPTVAAVVSEEPSAPTLWDTRHPSKPAPVDAIDPAPAMLVEEPVIDVEPVQEPVLVARSSDQFDNFIAPEAADEPKQVDVAQQVAEPTDEATPAIDAEAGTEDVPAVVAPIGDARLSVSALNADIALGQTRVVMLAGLTSHRDYAEVSRTLVTHALRRGLSVVRVDAGTGRPTTEPGLTDLSIERASFGDVVHRRGQDNFAEVPWGHMPVLDRRSNRPLTLIEALADIYEVVVLETGKVGPTSSLPVFTEVDGRIVLVVGEAGEQQALEEARTAILALGYPEVEIMPGLSLEAEVA